MIQVYRYPYFLISYGLLTLWIDYLTILRDKSPWRAYKIGDSRREIDSLNLIHLDRFSYSSKVSKLDTRRSW